MTNDYPKRLTVRATFTATIGPTNPGPAEKITLQDKFQLVDGDLMVAYSQGLETEAREGLQELRHQHAWITEHLKIKPAPWAVVLVPMKEKGRDAVLSHAPGYPHLWVFGVPDLKSGRMAQINLHEWVEHTLNKELEIYRFDRRNRFIGDGLAEPI